MSSDISTHLRVFEERSELYRHGGRVETFHEGPSSEVARKRYEKIRASLAGGYLNNQIKLCKEEPGNLRLDELKSDHMESLDTLVDSMNSENGRALIGLTILQLCVKAIEPDQSIRLHKGGRTSRNFSWREGISMRSLDKSYITPKLREHGLLRLNADGFMMTRSLAENYPYSSVYKAWIRGARKEWAKIVEGVESEEIESESALHYLLSRLLNTAEEFQQLAEEALKALAMCKLRGTVNRDSAAATIMAHIRSSNYRARVMEIAMHSLMQALEESDLLDDAELEPLSQMRSANKKHGNIGDIEVFEGGRIVESWDAKYGKSYLRDELEELNDKLQQHPNVTVAGFVTSEDPEALEELNPRRMDIEESHEVSIKIVSLDNWVNMQFDEARRTGLTEKELAEGWLTAYVESLSLRRLEKAPIDEPCHQWVESLIPIMRSSCE